MKVFNKEIELAFETTLDKFKKLDFTQFKVIGKYDIEQRWIVISDGHPVRLRTRLKKELSSGTMQYFFTTKFDSTDQMRYEYENEIGAIEYSKLNSEFFIHSPLIHKIRTILKEKSTGLVWEFDYYPNCPMDDWNVSIECEFPNEESAQVFIKPKWLLEIL